MYLLAAVAPPAPAAQSLGVAYGVVAPLSAWPYVLDRSAQGGAQTVICGDAALPQQDNNTSFILRQMSRRAKLNITSFISTEAKYPSRRCTLS
jgi:hypothetical protein